MVEATAALGRQLRPGRGFLDRPMPAAGPPADPGVRGGFLHVAQRHPPRRARRRWTRAAACAEVPGHGNWSAAGSRPNRAQPGDAGVRAAARPEV